MADSIVLFDKAAENLANAEAVAFRAANASPAELKGVLAAVAGAYVGIAREYAHLATLNREL